MAHPLDPFLKPRSIAILGASPDPHKLRGMLTRTIVQNGYAGELYFVNPTHKEIEGRRCYPSVTDVPQAPDLAIVVVPAKDVIGALEACVQRQARSALVMSSGFAEEGGAQSGEQQRLVEIAKTSGIRLSGPNAEGYHNALENISATFSPAVLMRPERLVVAAPRRVGVVAQSGGVGFALYNRGRALGLDFSYCITSGNEADLTAADFLDFLVDDADTAAILMFLETIRDPVRFAAAATRAAARAKPVIVVKVGRSAAGSAATMSHTGAMAGWDAAYDAAFRKCGVTAVADLDHALAIAAAVTTSPLPRGNRAAVVTVSGGGGAMVADALEGAGYELPALAAPTQAAIRAIIPSYGSTRNPVDVTGQATRTGAPLKTIEMLTEGDEVDLIVAVVTMSNETRAPVDPPGLKALVAKQKKPILFFTYTLPSDFGLRSLASADTVAFTSLSGLAAAAGAMLAQTHFTAADAGTARGAPDATLAGRRGALAEHEAKSVLARNGIDMPPARLLREGESDITGMAFPVAAKIQSPDIAHKTEAGGVALGIASPAALVRACAELYAAARRYKPDARVDGVLVEPMAPRGVEMIVGVVRDPTWGPVVTVGAGGTATELYRDVVRRTAPIGPREAASMVRELKSFPLLDGFRGAPKVDVPAFATLVTRLAQFTLDNPNVRELELNPVIVHPGGCAIVDAMLVLDR